MIYLIWFVLGFLSGIGFILTLYKLFNSLTDIDKEYL
jgi:hypothetical protein